MGIDESNLNQSDNFIPIPVSELINRISSHCKILFRHDAEADQLSDLFEIMVYYYHHRLFENVRRMKFVYHPFSPDNELFNDFELDHEFDIEEGNFKSEFISLLMKYLNKANYEKVPDSVLRPYLHSSEKDFDERRRDWIQGFSSYTLTKSRKELMFYAFYRGATNDTHPTMLSRFLGKLFFQTPLENLPFVKRQKKFQKYNSLVLLHLDELGKYQLKLYKSVNSEQIINLIPSNLVKLKVGFWAWIFMFIMLISSLFMGLSRGFRFFDFLPSGVATVVFSGIVIFFLYKFFRGQIYKKTKREYKRVKKQAHQLLASNEKVLSDLGAQAEEEELKELILGYYALFLRQHDKLPPRFNGNIKEFIQNFLKNHCHIDKKVDFEIADSIRKLLEMGFFKKDSIERIHRIGYISDDHLMKLKTDSGILTEGELEEIVKGVILLDETKFTDLVHAGLFRFPETATLIKSELLKETMLEIYKAEEIIDDKTFDFINSVPSNPSKFFNKEILLKIDKAVKTFRKDIKKNSISRRLNSVNTQQIQPLRKIFSNKAGIRNFEYSTTQYTESFDTPEAKESFENSVNCMVSELEIDEKYRDELCHIFTLIDNSIFDSVTLIDKTLLKALYEAKLITDEGFDTLYEYSNIIEKILFESLQLKIVTHEFLSELNDIIIERELLPNLAVREPLGAFAHIDSIWDTLFVSWQEQFNNEIAKKRRATQQFDRAVLKEREEVEAARQKYETSTFSEQDDIMKIRIYDFDTASHSRRNQIETVLDDLHDKFDRIQQKRKQMRIENKKYEDKKKRRYRKINRIAALFALLTLLGFCFNWFSLEKAATQIGIEVTENVPKGYLNGFELIGTEFTDVLLSKILLTNDRVFPFRIILILIPFVSLLFVFKIWGNRSEQDFGGRWATTCGIILIVYLFSMININYDYGLKFISPSMLQFGLILSTIGLLSVFSISFLYTPFLKRVFVVLIMVALLLDLVFEHYGEYIDASFLNNIFGL